MNEYPLVQLCKTADEDRLLDDNYYAEPKLDGCRCLAIKKDDTIILVSRKQKIFENRSEINNELKKINGDFILDGEVAFVNKKGQIIYLTANALDDKVKEYGVESVFIVFDILNYNGKDIKILPIEERKSIINVLITENKFSVIHDGKLKVRLVEIFNSVKEKKALWMRELKNGAEGVVLKRKSSIYKENERNDDWLKIKFTITEDVIVKDASYLVATATFKKDKFGIVKELEDGTALVNGIGTMHIFNEKGDDLGWCGVQKDEDIISLLDRFDRTNDELITKKPFFIEVLANGYTIDGKMRHPRLFRIRDDK